MREAGAEETLHHHAGRNREDTDETEEDRSHQGQRYRQHSAIALAIAILGGNREHGVDDCPRCVKQNSSNQRHGGILAGLIAGEEVFHQDQVDIHDDGLAYKEDYGLNALARTRLDELRSVLPKHGMDTWQRIGSDLRCSDSDHRPDSAELPYQSKGERQLHRRFNGEVGR